MHGSETATTKTSSLAENKKKVRIFQRLKDDPKEEEKEVEITIVPSFTFKYVDGALELPYAATRYSPVLATAVSNNTSTSPEEKLRLKVLVDKSSMRFICSYLARRYEESISESFPSEGTRRRGESELDLPRPITRTMTHPLDLEWESENEKIWIDAISKMQNQELIKLLNAANYLEITYLVRLCCVKIAALLRGKSLKEFKQTVDFLFRGNTKEEIK